MKCYNELLLLLLLLLFLLGSGDIIEGNIKLILGLVWTLILHYQISMGFNIDDDDDGGQKKSGKQALLEYIQVHWQH